MGQHLVKQICGRPRERLRNKSDMYLSEIHCENGKCLRIQFIHELRYFRIPLGSISGELLVVFK
jgi:hypothetical protein